jgi:gamma-glutamyl:cysteine ligase YbdK (ATP-grasp superfamily)
VRDTLTIWLSPMAPIDDPYREQAEREFYEDVTEGRTDQVRQPRAFLGGRSLHDAWTDGDHEIVEKWLAEAYARNEAAAEQLGNDPQFVEMMRRRMVEIDERQAEEQVKRDIRVRQFRRTA